MSADSGFILWLKNIDDEDSAAVGDYASRLGELINSNFPIPDGFVVTIRSFNLFIKNNNLGIKIKHILTTIDYSRPETILHASTSIKKHFMQAAVTENLAREIFKNYNTLGGFLKESPVRISPSAMTGCAAKVSNSGLNSPCFQTTGEANVLMKIKEVWAGLYSADAIFYRHEKNINQLKTDTAVIIQKIPDAEKSGKFFTIDPVFNDNSKIIVEAILGAPENHEAGKTLPDRYEIKKHDLLIIKKIIAEQSVMLKRSGLSTKTLKLNDKNGMSQKLTDKEILSLASIAKKLERHLYFPQESQWLINNGKIFISDTRPFTGSVSTRLSKDLPGIQTVTEAKNDHLIAQGVPASPGIVTGIVKKINSSKQAYRIEPGTVLVAAQTDSGFDSMLKKASAIVVENGGKMSHAGLLARKTGIPAIVGLPEIFKKLNDGQAVTVNGLTGTISKAGIGQKYSTTQAQNAVLKTATKIYLSVDLNNPTKENAVEVSDGAGVLYSEGVVKHFAVHPKQIFHGQYKNEFVKTLTDKLESAAKAFRPKPVIYRMADITSDVSGKLSGGKSYEPQETNPILGYHGTYRSMHDPLLLNYELEAIKTVRNKYNLKNVQLMIPFVRTIEELVSIKKTLAIAGLHRSPTFKLWLSVALPANIFLLEKFIAAGIDGFAIDTHYLTMLSMGVDKKNTEIAAIFDESHEAMMPLYEKIIKTAGKHNIPSAVYGSNHLTSGNILEKLIRWGISGISVTSDAADMARQTIAGIERKIIMKQ